MFYLKFPAREWLSTAWYPGYAEGLPDLLVAKVPQELLPSAWKVWIVETAAERQELLAALEKPAKFENGVIRFAYAADAGLNGVGNTGIFDINLRLLYPTPADVGFGWPFISLYRFRSVEAADASGAGLMRGLYTLAFDRDKATALERINHQAQIDAQAGTKSTFVHPVRRRAN